MSANKAIEYEELLPGNVFVLKGVLSPEECQQYIKYSQDLGFKPATIKLENDKSEEIFAADVRNNDRVVIENDEVANLLWNRIQQHIPPQFAQQDDGAHAVAISNVLRFYRYDVGQRFVRHFDGYDLGSMLYDDKKNKNKKKESQKPATTTQARLSIIVYLNDGFRGGATTFFSSKGTQTLQVQPQAGKVLIYNQRLLHEGSSVEEGTKFVIRSDILFALPSSTVINTTSSSSSETSSDTSSYLSNCLVQ